MLELYYRPMACSLASRIAIEEAGLDARYRRVDLATHTLDDGSDYRALAPKGQVPLLVGDDALALSENSAVLQYLADRAPEAGLAPAPGTPERYRLQEWLNFIATELHKQFAFPQFMDGTPESVREHGRARFEAQLPFLVASLEDGPFLLGETFTVADAYLAWVLTLARFSGVELPERLTAFLECIEARPGAARAFAAERAEIAAELRGDAR